MESNGPCLPLTANIRDDPTCDSMRRHNFGVTCPSVRRHPGDITFMQRMSESQEKLLGAPRLRDSDVTVICHSARSQSVSLPLTGRLVPGQPCDLALIVRPGRSVKRVGRSR